MSVSQILPPNALSRLKKSIGAALVGFIQAGVGAVLRTVQDKLRDFVHVADFGAVGDGVADDTAAIVAALAAHKHVRFGAGTYLISAPITLQTGHFLQGEGRRDGGTTITVSSNAISAFAPASNARGIVLRGLNITSPAGGTNAAILPDAVGGTAENTIEQVNVSGFKYWIKAGNLYWNNVHRDCRISCSNSIEVLDVNGTSLKNLFESVYFDESGLSNTLTVNATACSTMVFLNCNFGGSPTSGQFVSAITSCYGWSFIGCNFELQRVPAASWAFRFSTRGQAVFESCTFADIDELGANAALFEGIGVDTWVSLKNCELVNSNSSITYYFRATGANFTLDNSPDFDVQAKYVYATSGGLYGQIIRNISEEHQEVRSLAFRKIDALARPIAAQDIFTLYSSTGAIHDLLSFTHGAPGATDDSTVVCGELTVAFSGRSDAGVRINGHARWDVYYNNDGAATITRSAMQSVGSRTVDLAVTQVGAVFRLTVTPSAGAITSGKVTATFRHLKSQNVSSDIAVAFVP